jgi:energy-coupling factor transporter ATP-binding protein EcfA2
MDRTQALKEFLDTQPLKVDLYTPEMEVQVNVIPGPGRDNQGKSIIWNDDEYIWSAFRIPHKGSGSEARPSYTGINQEWPITKYAEAIGLTGWDWFNRKSRWVGFDFDSIVSHKQGLTDDELEEIREQVKQIPWITLRRSTGGSGYHIYVHFEHPPDTRNHYEHAALARCILGNLSSLLGFNFDSKVDGVGGVLWIWHRKADKEKGSFQLLKEGIPLKDIPPNWKDHLTAVKQKRKPKIRNCDDSIESLLNTTKKAELDNEHRRLLAWFSKQNTTWWWDADYDMLICHTHDLKRAHQELNLKGIYDTESTGKNTPGDHNCFAFPLFNGGWSVRRYTLNCSEHKYWVTDPSGWVRCNFNCLPNLYLVAAIENGIRTSKGSYQFKFLENAANALKLLGVEITYPREFTYRKTELRSGKLEGEVVINVKREENDDSYYDNWAEVRGPLWERVVNTQIQTQPEEIPDELIRYTVINGQAYKWFVNSNGKWVSAGKDDSKSLLLSSGIPRGDLEIVLGNAIKHYWEIVNIPFAEEYPSDRRWNINCAQLAFNPKAGDRDSWDLIFNHVGQSLDSAVANNEWCQYHNIPNGKEYLKLWVSSILQYPFEPLPYLFLYGPQESGKSILHEALALLFKGTIGYVRADHALTSENGFNGELHNAVLCVVEETNLLQNKKAAERIKDWVTSPTLSIRRMRTDTFVSRNTTHWIQCSNHHSYCPILPGDTRIVASFVGELKEQIPKRELLDNLTQEAPAFLNEMLTTEIPHSNTRLRIPVIDTSIKASIELAKQPILDGFISEFCEYVPGNVVPLRMFFDQFIAKSVDAEKANYTTRRISKELPPHLYPTGRWGDGGQIHIGNIVVAGLPRKQARNGKVECIHGKLR